MTRLVAATTVLLIIGMITIPSAAYAAEATVGLGTRRVFLGPRRPGRYRYRTEHPSMETSE